MTAWVVVVPLLIQSGIGVRVESLRSELDDWPTRRLEDATVRALERTAKDTWAEHYLTSGDDIRGDVALKGVLAPLEGGPKVRFTWKLETQDCPVLNDAVGFDFNSSMLTDAGLDTMMRALTKRAARLVERAKAQRANTCIDSSDIPSPEELELRKARAAAIAKGLAPVTPKPTPPPQPQPPPVPVLRKGQPVPVRDSR